jgi:hypothetical protein
MNESEVLANEDGRNFTEHQYRISILEEEGVMTLFRILKPKFGKDGNEWYVLHGEDLVSGICGYGKTLNSAIQDFNNQFDTEIKTNKNLIKKKMTNKPPEIGKRYKNKYNGKNYSAVTYLGSDPEISCRLCCENDLMSDLNSRPTNNNFDKDFEELQDQEPVKEHVKNLYTKEEHVKKTEKSLHERSIWKPISEKPISELLDYDQLVICKYSYGYDMAITDITVDNKLMFRNLHAEDYKSTTNLISYCTLTDFINKQESLEQRITDLEKRLISNAV